MNSNQQKESKKKEKVLMLFCATLVLAALTMTGVHMRNVGVKGSEEEIGLPGESLSEERNRVLSQLKNNGENLPFAMEEGVPDSDLDYFPEEDLQEASTGKVENPGVDAERVKAFTEEITKKREELQSVLEERQEQWKEVVPTPVQEVTEALEEVQTPDAEEEVTLVMGEGQRLIRPVSGETVIPFDMEHTVYFATLDQYKLNPGEVLAATAGEDVISCARGRITNIYSHEELGQVVEMELGSGYKVTYGQLAAVQVNIGQIVECGQKIGVVADPTMYYSVEGTNLYFEVKRDGIPINPESLF